jgi:hypothetical protein
MCAFHTCVQDYGLFAILGKDGDCNTGHESGLSVQIHATNFLRPGQVTIVIELTSDEAAGWVQVPMIFRNLPD